jgi:hypothetical protein
VQTKPKVTQIREAILAELEFLQPTYVNEIVATLDDQAAFEAQIPFIRIKRGDAEINIGDMQEFEHALEIELTYVNALSAEIDDQIDYILEESSQLLTRSQSLADLIDYITPTETTINDVESDTPLISATIKFTITYSQGV